MRKRVPACNLFSQDVSTVRQHITNLVGFVTGMVIEDMGGGLSIQHPAQRNPEGSL